MDKDAKTIVLKAILHIVAGYDELNVRRGYSESRLSFKREARSGRRVQTSPPKGFQIAAYTEIVFAYLS